MSEQHSPAPGRGGVQPGPTAAWAPLLPWVRAVSGPVWGGALARGGGGGGARLGVCSACVWLGPRGEGTRWGHFPSQPGRSSEAPGTCSRTADPAASCPPLPGPAQPSPARPGPGHLRRPSPWLASCTVGQEPGWRCRGQTSGRIPPRGDRRQIRGARPGGVGLDRGALSRRLLQRRSPVHCRGDMRYDFCLKPLGPARPRPHSGTTPSVRPLTSPSRPSLRLARGGGGLADSRRCWHRARSPGWPKGRWHLSVPLSCEDK